MSAVCRRCGRVGHSQFSSDYSPGLYCSNFAACTKRLEARDRRAAAEPPTEGDPS